MQRQQNVGWGDAGRSIIFTQLTAARSDAETVVAVY